MGNSNFSHKKRQILYINSSRWSRLHDIYTFAFFFSTSPLKISGVKIPNQCLTWIIFYIFISQKRSDRVIGIILQIKVGKVSLPAKNTKRLKTVSIIVFKMSAWICFLFFEKEESSSSNDNDKEMESSESVNLIFL